MGDNTIDEQLQWLARGPSTTIMQDQGYEINGYTFYTRAQDEKSTNQNGGVRIDVIGNDEKKDSWYGVTEDIWTFEDSFVSLPMGEPNWRRRNNRPVWDYNSGLQKDWI
jgi:hypothetical protein